MINTTTHNHAAGTTLVTMMVGHIVEVRIDALTDDGYDVTFLRHYATSKTRLALDIGAGWYIEAGDKEHTEDRFIDRAIELVNGGK